MFNPVSYASAGSLAVLTFASLMGSARGPMNGASAAGAARPFASRAESSVRPAEALVAVETRPSSPLPFAGAEFEPEPRPAPEPAVAALPRERHELTSFDGTRTMSDSGTTLNAEPAPAAPRPWAPAPVVWNNPIRWIGVHQNGL